MAVIDNHCEKAIEFSKTLNPEIIIENGINWIWAHGFKTWEDASKFNNYCHNNNCETRGIYPGDKDTFDVRFR